MAFDSPPHRPFLAETHRDAERGGGQRDGDVEEKAGGGENQRGAQKIPFAQTERNVDEEENPELEVPTFIDVYPLSNKRFPALAPR